MKWVRIYELTRREARERIREQRHRNISMLRALQTMYHWKRCKNEQEYQQVSVESASEIDNPFISISLV